MNATMGYNKRDAERKYVSLKKIFKRFYAQ